jgi:flavin reductase (DIM6/NTAB) family NADH-FMN oxidoreductase RutF
MGIDQALKRSLGQMAKGVQIVSASDDGVVRAYTSHWVCQVSFEEPIVLASISPKHDTWPLLVSSGRFAVSVLAGDQIEQGQYFSYPGRRFERALDDYLVEEDGWWVAAGAISWFGCEVLTVLDHLDTDTGALDLDHRLVFARVVAAGQGRLREPALVYSSRQGWRIADTKARAKGTSVRDDLLARVEQVLGRRPAEIEGGDEAGDDG